MDSPTTPQATRLDLRTSLYAHRALIAICAILGTMAGIAAMSLVPVTYAATVSVLVQPLDGNPYSPSAQGSDLTNLETEAQVVSSDVIAAEVRSNLLQDDWPANSRKGLRIIVSPNTQIVQVTYVGSGAAAAEATAQQYAESYLDFRTERRNTFVENKRATITERLDLLTKQLAKFRKQGRPADDSEARSVAAQQTNLRLQEAELVTADDNPGEVISTPAATKSGFSIPWQLGGVAGLLLGLAFGAVVALILERRSELLRTVDDIEHLGVAVLGSHTNSDVDDLGSADAVGETLYDVANLAATILNRRSDAPATVAISSLSGGGSVAHFVDDLANVLSQGREGVLLIDAASEVPTRSAGFSEVLSGTAELKASLVKRVRGKPVDPVARLLVGKDPGKAFSLYSTSRMSDALDTACAEYNWVLVQSPGSESTVGRAVVGACRYWIPIVELGIASREGLERGLAWARTTGVETLGVVVIDSPLNIFGRAKKRDPETVSGD
jgi:polysaccharide biosynthesis transport protein